MYTKQLGTVGDLFTATENDYSPTEILKIQNSAAQLHFSDSPPTGCFTIFLLDIFQPASTSEKTLLTPRFPFIVTNYCQSTPLGFCWLVALDNL